MSDGSYVSLPVTADATALTDAALDDLMTLIPGWVPQEGHLEVALIEVLSRYEAETRDVASRASEDIFRYFGRTLLNLPAVDAAYASVKSTWEMVDSAGYTIPAGTTVSWLTSGNTEVFFSTANEVVVPPGSTTTVSGAVELVAVEPGAANNGLNVGALRVVDALAYVKTIWASGSVSGGQDAETDAEYRSRLADELRLMTPRPIVADDFAVLAQRIPGVHRAIALDGYNPENATNNNERMVAVALVDESGNPVSTQVKYEVVLYLDSLREVNFVVNVLDPTYTNVDVSATLKKLPGYDSAAISSAAQAKLRDYLSPAKWDWRQTVAPNELISMLDQLPGVDYVEAVTKPTGDISLAGAASLVRAGVINISVLD